MLLKGKLTRGEKIGLTSIILAIVIPLIFFVAQLYMQFQSPDDSEKIIVNSSLNRLIKLDDILNLSSLSFDNKCSDSLEICELDKSIYKYDDEINLNVKLDGMGNNRKISIFLIDSNDFIRMSYPALNNNDLLKITNTNLRFGNFIRNESNIEIDINKKLEIKFLTDFSKMDNIITYGDCRAFIIIWNQQIDNTYKPTKIITKTIKFEQFEENKIDDVFFLIIVIAIVSIIIFFIDFIVNKKKKVEQEYNKLTKNIKTVSDEDAITELFRKSFTTRGHRFRSLDSIVKDSGFSTSKVVSILKNSNLFRKDIKKRNNKEYWTLKEFDLKDSDNNQP